MSINDHQLKQILNKNNNHSRNYINNNTQNNNSYYTLVLDLAKIYSIEIRFQWFQIEYLSLRNSLLKNIDFIINMPNLFYLDLYQNPIESFTPFLISNSFGYLCFSPPANYFEQKILSIEKMNAIFLIANIKSVSIKKMFLQKNPNILVINNDIIDFDYKIKLLTVNQGQKDTDTNNKNKKKEDEKNNIKIDINFVNKFKVKNKERCTNKKIIDIENFINNYNSNMLNFQREAKINYNQIKINLEEKKKLIFISDCYLNILELNNSNNNYYYKYIPIKEKKDKNIIDYSNLQHFQINLSIFKNFTIPSLKEFLLSIFILYIFKILSKDISFELLRLILLKSHYYLEDKKRTNNLDTDILNILNLKSNLLICLYYKIYDILFGIFSNKRLSEIQVKLQMNEITDKIMNIIQHQNNFIKMIEKETDPVKKGNIIRNELILFLNQNNIFNNILMIIQYVDDYIIYNSIQKKLALKNSKDLQFFVNIKNYMYFSLDKRKDNIQSMAEKKYAKIQMKSLFNNKYFFDTENYMKTNQYFTNVFLNYKHGIFYPDKNKIKKYKNNDIEEELKNKEKEKIKNLYVQNNLNSFFNIIKEKKQIKLNKNINTMQSQSIRKDQNKNNEINLKTFNNSNYLYNNIYNKNQNNNNIRKIDNIDFELMKKSQDKLYKTSSNYNKILTPKNNLYKGIEAYYSSNKKNRINETKINNNINNKINLLYSPISTNNNKNNSHNLYKKAINNFSKNDFDKNKLKYLEFNSMNEVLNNLDLTDKEIFEKFKNKLINKKYFQNLTEKIRKKPKSIQTNNLKMQNRHGSKRENSGKYRQGFYYNKSLGCKINYRKIMLGENENNSEENTFNKIFEQHENSPINNIKPKNTNYPNFNREKLINTHSNIENEIKKKIYLLDK